MIDKSFDNSQNRQEPGWEFTIRIPRILARPIIWYYVLLIITALMLGITAAMQLNENNNTEFPYSQQSQEAS